MPRPAGSFLALHEFIFRYKKGQQFSCSHIFKPILSLRQAHTESMAEGKHFVLWVSIAVPFLLFSMPAVAVNCYHGYVPTPRKRSGVVD